MLILLITLFHCSYVGGGTQDFLDAVTPPPSFPSITLLPVIKKFLISPNFLVHRQADSTSAMHRGVVADWDLMARTWDFIVNTQVFMPNSVAGVQRPFPDVGLTHGVGEDPRDKETATEILFDVLNCSSVSMISQARAVNIES